LVANNPPTAVMNPRKPNTNNFVGIQAISMLGRIDQGFLKT